LHDWGRRRKCCIGCIGCIGFILRAKGAQLLFTGHNPAILDELEKEQLFFPKR